MPIHIIIYYQFYLILAIGMDSQRISVRNNFQVYQGQFVYRFLLGCFKQTCYVMLKKGTIYIYDSKRSCLNEPQKPKLFFNLNMTKIVRNGHFLTLEDCLTNIKLWSVNEEGVSMLEQNANFNKSHLDPQRVFPKKFIQLNSRIDQKLQYQKMSFQS